MLLGIMIEISGVPTAILMNLYFNNLYSESINLNLSNKKLLDETEHLKKIVSEESAEKTWLMRTMSHDLSQPVQALNIFLDSLKLEVKNPKQLGILNKAKQSSQELTGLLKSLMEIGKLESSDLQTHIQAVNLSTILQNLIDETNNQAQKKQINIINLTAETIVFSDKILLTRIIRNLLINAIYHNENCQIYLKTTQEKNKVKLDIYDTGKGIKQADLNKIFDPYYQTNHINEGFGLGLSLVKKATKVLNIPISVSSKVSYGTCFSLKLEAITT